MFSGARIKGPFTDYRLIIIIIIFLYMILISTGP